MAGRKQTTEARTIYRTLDRLSEEDRGWMQLATTAFLAEIAAGRIGARQLARETLAARGIGLTGTWVGFEAAQRLHGLRI